MPDKFTPNKRFRPDVRVNIASEGQPLTSFSQQPKKSRQPKQRGEVIRKKSGERSEECIVCSVSASVMVIQATISNHPARSLLDSGASGNFVTAQFISKFSIPTENVQPRAVRLADGQLLHVSQIVSNVPVTVNRKTVYGDFMVLSELNNGHDCILGIPWLELANPVINFQERTIEWRESKLRLSPKYLVPSIVHPLNWNRDVEIEAEDDFFLVNISETRNRNQLNAMFTETVDPTLSPSAQQLIKQYASVFPPELPKRLPPLRGDADLKIRLLPSSAPPSTPPFRMSSVELTELKRQIDSLLSHGFIKPSLSEYGSPVLFVRKKTGELRMCIDYRKLNSITIKNSYGLPRIEELLDSIQGARWFSTLDLNSGYHQLRVNPADTHKTAFRTRYGLFEFCVVPFGLTGAPATFMKWMQQLFHHLLDKSVVVFLDDILIYSKTEEEHQEHLRQVLEILKKNGLYAKAPKCQLFKRSVNFLGHVLDERGLSMERDKVRAIQEWPQPKNRKEILSFLGLAGYYRRFVKNFSQLSLKLTELLKNEAEWNWSVEVEQSFQALKRTITTAPVLRSPDLSKPFVVTTDASGFATGAELSQEFEGQLQPIAFMSKKLSPAERNYPVHEQELLAVIQAIREWKCYLDGRRFTVNTDHKSLIYLQKQPHLSSRQTRWVEFLAQFDFDMQYKSGKLNTVADALSRRSDYNDSPAVNAIVETINSSLVGQLISAQASDEFCQRVLKEKLPVSEVNGGLSVRGGVVYKDQRIVVPADSSLKTKILQRYHDHPLVGHVGSEKTTELVKRDFYWPKMDEEIKLYVTTCHSCQKNKPSHQFPVGLLKPLEIPARHWSHVSMDFIGPLPKSNGYNAITVVVDKLTKLVHLIATTTTVTAKEVALLFFDNVVRLHGVPDAIITDRDARFTSLFWKELMKLMGIQQRMSSSFHPQSDGQTERTNRTLETMLRHYVNERNNDWAKHLTAAEIAINNCQQSSTKYSPFYMNCGFNPRFPFLIQSTVKASVSSAVPAAEEIVKTIQLTTQQAIQNLQRAQQQQSQQANRKRRDDEFKVGEQVYLSTDKLNITSGVSKLNPKFIGPFTITKVINPVAVQLQLPHHFKIHNSFHVSRIKRAKSTDQFPNRPTLEKPPPVIQADHEEESEWEVEKIVDKRQNRGKVEYLVKWRGYDSHDNQWITGNQLANAQDAMKEFEESLIATRLNAIASDRVGSSVQCSAQTKAGRQCRKRTLRSGLCQIHLNRDHNLRIKQSTIPGAKLGLFSGDKLTKRNEIVTPYTGQASSTEMGGKYVLEVNKHHFINANRHIDTGGFANECRLTNKRENQCRGNNSKFAVNQSKRQAWIKATKIIPPNTEIFVPYGAEYWREFDKKKIKNE